MREKHLLWAHRASLRWSHHSLMHRHAMVRWHHTHLGLRPRWSLKWLHSWREHHSHWHSHRHHAWRWHLHSSHWRDNMRGLLARHLSVYKLIFSFLFCLEILSLWYKKTSALFLKIYFYSPIFKSNSSQLNGIHVIEKQMLSKVFSFPNYFSLNFWS